MRFSLMKLSSKSMRLACVTLTSRVPTTSYHAARTLYSAMKVGNDLTHIHGPRRRLVNNSLLGIGAGVVLDVGSAITSVVKGDKVLMSFSHCESCPWCVSGQPAYCCNFNNRNFGGKRPDGSSAMFSTAAGQKKNLFSSFFGQSSFARHTVVHQSCLVRVAPETPLDLFAPLGCGIQTGVGAVLNTLRVKSGSSVAVFGVGAVGMAAVMAAKLCQAKTIIAIDLHPGRLELATQLGATHSILGSDQRVVDKIQEICPPVGVDYAVDCTGVPAVVEKMVAALGTKGRAATVGAPGSNSQAKIDIMSHLTYGKEYVGCSEGDSNPYKVSLNMALKPLCSSV